MQKAGSTMAGHPHPLIIRLISETVWTAGDFTSFDASWSMGHSNSHGPSGVP